MFAFIYISIYRDKTQCSSYFLGVTIFLVFVTSTSLYTKQFFDWSFGVIFSENCSEMARSLALLLSTIRYFLWNFCCKYIFCTLLCFYFCVCFIVSILNLILFFNKLKKQKSNILVGNNYFSNWVVYCCNANDRIHGEK